MEIEVRVKAPNLEEIKQKLEEQGFVFEAQKEQEDLIFKKKGHEKENVGPGSSIVRLRKSGGSAKLGYKELTDIDGVWVEHESNVEDYEEVKKIIEKLDLVKTIEMHKKRTEGKLDKISVCLDDIKELGKFIEVEIISEEPKAAKQELVDFIKKLGFKEQEIIHKGYVRILLERWIKENK